MGSLLFFVFLFFFFFFLSWENIVTLQWKKNVPVAEFGLHNDFRAEPMTVFLRIFSILYLKYIHNKRNKNKFDNNICTWLYGHKQDVKQGWRRRKINRNRHFIVTWGKCVSSGQKSVLCHFSLLDEFISQIKYSAL